MAIDETWEDIFSTREWGQYPNEDVIRFVARNFYNTPSRKEIKILDLGCGGGAHTWYMSREGFDVYAIDGSQSAIKQTYKLLIQDGLNATLQCDDIKHLSYKTSFFDAVVDCNTVQHNYWADIQAIHNEIFRVLKPNGLMLSIMLSEGTTGYENAEKLEKNTFRGFQNGFITPNVFAHLYTRKELDFLMTKYLVNEISRITRTANDNQDCIAHYVVTACKRVA